ncbi:hypothetical protein ACFLWK_00515 [Chloroflexota bacterium]
MPQADWLILMGLGGLFLILGVVSVVGGKREEKGYYDSLSARPDMREFVEHTPQRPEPGALKIGGWITITIGVVMIALGGGFWLWS